MSKDREDRTDCVRTQHASSYRHAVRSQNHKDRRHLEVEVHDVAVDPVLNRNPLNFLSILPQERFVFGLCVNVVI